MWSSTYVQDMREIPAIVTEKIVKSVKIFLLRVGGTSLIMALAKNEQTDLHALNKFLCQIDKLSFKKKQHVSRPCSFGGEVAHTYVHAAE